MKKLFYILCPLLCLLTAIPANASGNDYRIKRLIHADNVKINGKKVSTEMDFSKDATIEWGKDDAAAMVVKEMATSRIYRLSKRQFESKGKIKTLQDFFLRTKKTSTRGDTDEAVITLKHCNNRFSFNERRIALVVGNTTYISLPSLQNPQSDAAAISDKLLSLGFDVVETYDCDNKELRSTLNQFEQIINRDGYQVVLFYYAGHGIQKDGKNYLVPVTSKLQNPADINNCIGCDDVLHSLEGTTCSSRIVIFDACRNFNSAISEKKHNGLAQIQQLAPGTILIYSTGFGQVANDGDGEHSPFAQALLDNIGKPAINFEAEIKNVANETYRITANRQYPAIAGSLTDNLILNPNSNTTATTATPTTVTTIGCHSSQTADAEIAKGKKVLKTFKYSEAYKYFLNAADMGSCEGYYQLGMLYINDNFEGADLDDASEWLTKAADLGHADAMYNLGLINLGRDNTTARQWFKKASGLGHEKAARQLKQMKNK